MRLSAEEKRYLTALIEYYQAIQVIYAVEEDSDEEIINKAEEVRDAREQELRDLDQVVNIQSLKDALK